jgi:hypothetical protein
MPTMPMPQETLFALHVSAVLRRTIPHQKGVVAAAQSARGQVVVCAHTRSAGQPIPSKAGPSRVAPVRRRSVELVGDGVALYTSDAPGERQSQVNQAPQPVCAIRVLTDPHMEPDR